ncbi:hypothetical protein F503_07474 [Ophiostoma piceae UAMH 11346]|uniref:Uncharacterized protein n=1 Tax=Ophiostoma piceae (strain UAMH 11346) TaxID=1262450 RepID=S3CSU5_OPHP1|nr:hypothetical protein F503_07474 [Ophiostoma piceae UAMH 11346]
MESREQLPNYSTSQARDIYNLSPEDAIQRKNNLLQHQRWFESDQRKGAKKRGASQNSSQAPSQDGSQRAARVPGQSQRSGSTVETGQPGPSGTNQQRQSQEQSQPVSEQVSPQEEPGQSSGQGRQSRQHGRVEPEAGQSVAQGLVAAPTLSQSPSPIRRTAHGQNQNQNQRQAQGVVDIPPCATSTSSPISEQAREHDEPQSEPLAESQSEPQPSPHTPSHSEVLEQIPEEDEEQSQLQPVVQDQGLQERGDEQAQSSSLSPMEPAEGQDIPQAQQVNEAATQAHVQAQTACQPRPSTPALEQAVLEPREAEEHPCIQLPADDEAQPLETTASRSSDMSIEHDQRNYHERGASDGSLASAIVIASTPRGSNAVREAPLEDSDSSMDEALRLQGPSAGKQPMDFL